MPAHHDDVKRTLEYGQSHDMARKALPWTLGAVALGLFLMSEPTGETDAKGKLLGGIVIALALGFLAVLIYRRAQPSIPSLVLSEQGILFRPISDKLIPWDEIRAVTRDKVSGSKDFFSTKVVRLDVSPAFYERYTQAKWFDSTIGNSGDPSAIYLAYHLDVPHDELLAAVTKRWHAFSHRAQGATRAASLIDPPKTRAASAYEDRPLGGSAAGAPSRRSRVMERASSFEGLRAFGGLFGGGGIGQALMNLAALSIILALLTNIFGYWATEAQLKGRAEAAKWKAWHAERDREQREFDAQQQRTREKFDRMFACMDETFRRRDLGISGDPECAKDKD